MSCCNSGINTPANSGILCVGSKYIPCPDFPIVNTINGLTGPVTILGGTGIEVVTTTPGTITLNNTGATTLVAGSGVSIIESPAGTFTISATGGGGFAEFFALMPGDNAATVAVGGSVDFPQNGAILGTDIVRATSNSFTLANIGVYDVSFQVSVTEPGQLAIYLNGLIDPTTVAGRATGTSQIMNRMLITTTVINTVLTVRNPAGNSTALTITPIAGGTHSVSATVVIKRIA